MFVIHVHICRSVDLHMNFNLFTLLQVYDARGEGASKVWDF